VIKTARNEWLEAMSSLSSVQAALLVAEKIGQTPFRTEEICTVEIKNNKPRPKFIEFYTWPV
jgi:hypothetical protein